MGPWCKVCELGLFVRGRCDTCNAKPDGSESRVRLCSACGCIWVDRAKTKCVGCARRSS
jgi:hypothetical protein